ncbi:MAG TPA: MraY family glycosyltransferase [Nitrosomonas mobilis]|nr:MraY family glycosyltransferase [Nitrosomonas mobilis]
MTHIIFLFILSMLLAVAAIHRAMILALKFKIADQPGGHKQHDMSTPFVGGVGIFTVLLISLITIGIDHPDQGLKWLVLGICSTIIFITGFVDDLIRLGHKIRLVIQSIAALIMILAGGVVLSNLGMLFSSAFTVSLGWFEIPFTIFATLGVINALNMIDGIDGLSGVVSLISLTLIGFLVLIAGDAANLTLVTLLAGGLIGFLYFNLRYSSQRRARVFLGDNGSMLLGFIFSWLLIDLSQGANQVMTPVTALWLFSVPLMDTASVMLRRIRRKESPFAADNNHLHHILLNAGFRVEDAVFVIGSLQLLLGTIGLAGLLLQLPEFIMFTSFLLVYFAYYYLTSRPWFFISLLRHFHTFLGLTPVKCQDLFLGSYSAREAEELVKKACKILGPGLDSWVHVFERQTQSNTLSYAVVINIRLTGEEDIAEEDIKRYIARMEQQMMAEYGILVRQFIDRSSKNERRLHAGKNPAERRFFERRHPSQRILLLEVMHDSIELSQSAKAKADS